MEINGQDLTLMLASLGERVTKWFHSMHYYPEIDSTNSFLMRQILQENKVEGVIVASGYQYKGRGRLDRIWVTPAGEQLAVSAVVNLDKFTVPSLLPLAVGLAVHATVQFYQVPAVLKWPNDVITNPTGEYYAGKVSGILIEIPPIVSGNNCRLAILGVGINYALSQDTKSHISGLYPPASIGDYSSEVSVKDLLSIFIKNLCTQLNILAKDPELVRLNYQNVCSSINREVVLYLPIGSEIVHYARSYRLISEPETISGQYCVRALARRIDPSGQLVVELNGEEFSVSSSDIVHLR